jgi:hypothetical protein
MKEVRVLCGGFVGLMLAAGTAAADRTMVVLLDATGSMQTIRKDSNGNCTETPCRSRFKQAQLDAATRVQDVQLNGGLLGVAVYKFFLTGTGINIVHEPPGSPDGFVAPFDAQTAILNATVTSERTPLAGAMCDAIDKARQSGTAATTTRFLEVYTDGGENNTLGPPCKGPFSVMLNTAPFDSGPPASWQHLVYSRAIDLLPPVQVDGTLYHNVSAPLALRTDPANPESVELEALGRPEANARAAVFASPATDVDLFSALAADTGGTFTEVVDGEPVPVSGDLDGDFDVDRNDAILMARQFGSPAVPAFDLNGDGKIGFDDYVLLIAHFSKDSGTPAPDPYTPSSTVNCRGAQTITIDGKVIENGGVTIQGTGSCHVIIRNSLIVSGAAAVTVRGSTVLEVENSIVVGEGQWLDARGSTLLSAADSVFHGQQKVNGAFAYTDRGGNTFEK